MSRADVERTLRMVPRRFKRNIYGLEEDIFEALDINVMYDEHGLCNAIGIGRGLGTEWEYDGYRLFSHPAREVRAWALARDPQLDPKDGFTSKLLGLAMGADWIDEPDLGADELQDPAESFVAFRPGYWEEEKARLIAAGLISP